MYSAIDAYHMTACTIDEAVRRLIAVGADPDHIGSGRGQRLDLGHRGIDILSPRGRHTLYRHGVAVSDHDGTDTDSTSWISRVNHGLVWHFWARVMDRRLTFRPVVTFFPADRLLAMAGTRDGGRLWEQAAAVSISRSPAFPKKPGFLHREYGSHGDSD